MTRAIARIGEEIWLTAVLCSSLACGGRSAIAEESDSASGEVGDRALGGSPTCGPIRAGAGGAVGATGQGVAAASAVDWYVDANTGADEGSGIREQPLKSLSCAALAARPGDTVVLVDGTWDASVDAKLGSLAATNCGVDSGIAFAENVNLRALNRGAVRVKSASYHGICMRGGFIAGIHFECLPGRPVVETNEGELSITASSWKNCSTFGLDISGTASVSVRSGDLSNYSEGPNPQFAALREQGALSVEGGRLSYLSTAFWLEDDASLALHGVTLQSYDATSMAGPAIHLHSGAPRLTIDSGTSFDHTAVAILGTSTTAAMTLDDVALTNGTDGIIVNETARTLVPKVSISGLVVTDLKSTGVNISGSCDLSITNSTFTRVGGPAVMVNGFGNVSLDHVAFVDGWGALQFTNSGGSLSIKVRNTSATGGEYAGVSVSGDARSLFDFGSLDSPGNNLFQANNLGLHVGQANLVFALGPQALVKAVGNSWDANQQGADSAGHYSVGAASVGLLVSNGDGPNYASDAANAGQLLLAGTP